MSITILIHQVFHYMKTPFIFILLFSIASICRAQQTVTHYFPQYIDSTSGQLSKQYIKEHFEIKIQGKDTLKHGKYVSFYYETKDTLQSGSFKDNKKMVFLPITLKMVNLNGNEAISTTSLLEKRPILILEEI